MMNANKADVLAAFLDMRLAVDVAMLMHLEGQLFCVLVTVLQSDFNIVKMLVVEIVHSEISIGVAARWRR